jgi:hypothetical protein
MDAYHRKVLRELSKKAPVPRKIKALHGDIEDAIVEAGGQRGGHERA